MKTARVVTRVTVGAAPDCEIVLADEAVSRRHLEIEASPEGAVVRDLGSRNGSFYLGQRFKEMTLALGARVVLGTTELVIDADRDDFEGTRGAPQSSYGRLVGASPRMQRLFTLLARLEGSLASVLVVGASGTGKELVARAIHDRSSRREGPFLALNCGALDRSLVRSELFGHKKGAFTGAHADAVGAFEAAHGGTLFLDEIGELPLELQPVLLRVLESGEFFRVGENKPRRASPRIIAATNRSLEEDVSEGGFREDLYYRLRVVQLMLPSLAERPEDIPLLVRRLSSELALPEPPPGVVEQLSRRNLRGNVRQLKNELIAFATFGEVSPDGATSGPPTDTLASFIDPSRPYAEQKEAVVDRMTYLYLKALIEKTGGNRSEASRIAGLQRGYLRSLLEKYGLD